MPNTYRIAVDVESTPPVATLVDSAGIAVASTPIAGDSEGSELKAWAQKAAEDHENAIVTKQAEAAAAAAAIANAESLKVELKDEVIVV